jgi:hypothetical protein
MARSSIVRHTCAWFHARNGKTLRHRWFLRGPPPEGRVGGYILTCVRTGLYTFRCWTVRFWKSLERSVFQHREAEDGVLALDMRVECQSAGTPSSPTGRTTESGAAGGGPPPSSSRRPSRRTASATRCASASRWWTPSVTREPQESYSEVRMHKYIIYIW